MENYLRSQLKHKPEQVKNYLEKTSKQISSFDQEQDLIHQIKIHQDTIFKQVDYNLKRQKELLEEKKNEFNAFRNEIINDEKEISSREMELAKLELEQQSNKHKIEDFRNKKLDYFNKINRLRRENNSLNEVKVKELINSNKEIKKLYKEYSLLLNFIKTRILNVEELSEKRTNLVLGYFLDIENFNFQLFKIDLSQSNHERLKIFWDSLGSILLKNSISNLNN